ncbi:Oxoglutarate/iron-dependent dioxygenase [Parasponia andersonii]|uniref:2-oxoglutarate-dependent dioxygenase DAO n=1 Tax=Parasponia andersonii TaxID=3476 RepID=A0A2P5BXA1_PARAD|nr:Oxoglutarate/iron-dependent dioxygenase [Parasponia andersonii]
MGRDQVISSGAIPVIDLKEFGDSRNSVEAYKKLRESCEEWGCFRLVNHPISMDLMSETKAVFRSLLDLPVEMKERNIDVINGSGYVAPSRTNPLYEALGLYHFGSTEAIRTFCDQLDASPHQRETIEKYAKAIYELVFDIGRKIARSMGFDDDIFKESWHNRFRINKYNFTPQSVGSSGVQIHTDSGFLTILQDDENVGGLEVMNKDGEFVAVDPWPGTFLVNLGDLAKAWSNGRFCNVKHRVQCKEAAIRVSIASFMIGPKDEAVEAAQELVDEDHPRLYVPYIYEDYLKIRLSKNLREGETLELLRVDM